jgi:hypothetical protein
MAREAMTQAVVTSMPYMDEDARTEVLHEWARAAGTKPPETSERISMEDFRNEIKQRIV